jgi:hypothetical protein
MNIPKIAISNEDDSSLQILGVRSSQMKNNSTQPQSSYKSIIKKSVSQPTTPSSTSTTSQSFHTCPTRLDSNHPNDFIIRKSSLKHKSSDQLQIKKQIIDENDTENDVSDLSQIEDTSKLTTSSGEQKHPKRRDTISTTSVLLPNKQSDENTHKRQYSLRKNHSFTTVNNDTPSTSILNKSSGPCFIPHVSTPPPPLPYAEESVRNSLTQISQQYRQKQTNPVRRTNSYRPTTSSSTLRRFIVRDGKLIEQEINTSRPIFKRRSTFDNSSYPMTQGDTSSIYETPKHENSEQFIQTNLNNSIRLVTDTNLNTQTTVNDQSDMQLDTTKQNPQETRVN